MRIIRLATLVLFSASLIGCAAENTESDSTVANATGTESADSDSADNDSAATAEDTILIDVRSQAEWDDGHVEQAVHIPHTEIADRISEVTEDKSAKIVVYCKSGGRAGTAKETLEDLGFTSVENIGGLEDAQERFSK